MKHKAHRSNHRPHPPVSPILPVSSAETTRLRTEIGNFLRLNSTGQTKAASQALERLFCLRGRFQSYPLLQDILSGKVSCHKSGAVHLIGQAAISPVMQSDLDDAVADCRTLLQLPMPCILLQCLPQPADIHLTLESFPGLALIRLSSLSPGFPDHLRSVIYHEIAHCFLTCGVRFLDEGFAYFFTHRFVAGTAPEPDEYKTVPLPDLRTLLSRKANMLFEPDVLNQPQDDPDRPDESDEPDESENPTDPAPHASSNLRTCHAACRAGADVISTLFALGGADRIIHLFHQVSRASTEDDILHLVNHASEHTLWAITNQHASKKAIEANTASPVTEATIRTSIPDTLNQAQTELLEQTREALFYAWLNKTPCALDHSIARLEAEPFYTHPALLDCLISAQLNRAIIAFHHPTDPTTARSRPPHRRIVSARLATLAHIDMLLKAAECLPPGRLWCWRGTRAVLALMMARPNIIKVATAGQHAFTAFAHASRMIPDDPDLLIQYGCLLLNAPINHGGNRDLGVSKLRQAMQNPAYHDHAHGILLDYGIDDTQKPITPTITTAAATAPTTAPPPISPISPASATMITTTLPPEQGHSPVTTTEIFPLQAPVILQCSGLELTLSPVFTLQPGNFTVRRGERIGIVGRNGSGKTVLLETLLGLRKPHNGTLHQYFSEEASTENHTHYDRDVRQKMGGLIESADFPGLLKVREIINLHRTLYRHTNPTITYALGLNELITSYWQDLSRGQRQRVLLWLALSHVPEIAFLDEPSLGLDEWYLRSLRELFVTLPTTLIIISHAPSDLMSMTRILTMEDGRITADGSLYALMQNRVGSFKGKIKQHLTPDSLKHLFALPGLLRPPQLHQGSWEMAGNALFDQSFRQFIEQHRITSFSLEQSSISDFLAHLCQVDRFSRPRRSTIQSTVPPAPPADPPASSQTMPPSAQTV